MAQQFNDLLKAAGINPSDVCIIRHQTPGPGKDHATLHDLWRDDPLGFAPSLQNTPGSFASIGHQEIDAVGRAKPRV